MSPWSYLIQGIALGLAAAMTPGALQAYLITQSIIYGFKRGSVIAFTPLISDPFVVIVILMSLNQVPQSFLRLISWQVGSL
jgi:threonine/homoserine/homoserine lactone efflux protein